MPSCSLERQVPHSPEQMFDLVIDIERYREFMPFTFEARITDRTADSLLANQTVGIGPVALRFASEARFRRPDWIEIKSATSQFRSFTIDWRFADLPEGSRIHAHVDCTPRSAVLEALIEPWIGGFPEGLVKAFEARAAALYGGRRQR